MEQNGFEVPGGGGGEWGWGLGEVGGVGKFLRNFREIP